MNLKTKQLNLRPTNTSQAATKTAGHGNRGIMNRNRPMRRPEPPKRALLIQVLARLKVVTFQFVGPGDIRIIPLGGVERLV